MTMLPDIDEQSWDEYARRKLQEQVDTKIGGFSLQSAIDEKISGLQGVIGTAAGAVGLQQPPPEPPPVAPPPPEPAPAPSPEPPPSPPVPAPPPPPELVSPPPELAPAVQELPAPPPAAAPTPPPEPAAALPAASPASAVATPAKAPTGDLSGWYDQIWQQGVGAVAQAGGNAQKFSDVWDQVQSGVQNADDAFSAGLGAAVTAGANAQQFASSFDPTPPPQPSVAQPAGVSGLTSGTGVQPTGELDSSSHQAFVSSIQPYAEKWSQIMGVPSDYLIAWAASESNWGKAGNALFGIKQASAPGTKAGLTSGTWEQGQGAITDTFADYNTPDQAFAGLDEFLQGKRYQGVYQQLRSGDISPDQFMQKINQAGYATDPIWGQKVGQIARQSVDPLMGAADQNILQRAGNAVTGAGQAAVSAVRGAANQVSQFGDPQLTSDEAYAACGPAAAVRFASMYGRNPSLREATDLARSVGWTPGSGMAGIGSEQKLLDKLGVPTKLVGADVQAMAKEAQTGNPVTISTPGHYFFADGYDAQSGAFHVGRSGTDLKGGSEWMTPAQMSARMGPIQGALFADNPGVPSPSVSDQTTNPASFLGRAKDTVLSSFGYTPPTEPATIQAHVNSSDPDLQALDQAVIVAHARQPSRPDVDVAQVADVVSTTPPAAQQTPVDRLKSAFSDFIDSVGSSQAVRNITGTNPNQADVEQRYQQAQQAAQAATGGTVQLPSELNPLAAAGSAPNQYAAGDYGDYLDVLRNKAIEENNPLRDVLGIGGATTAAAQAITDPSNLLLLGEPLIQRTGGRLAGEAAGLAGERLLPEAEAALRTRLPGAAEDAAAAVVPEVTAPATTRMYHGTAGAFERPEAGRFGEEGLFGPGYYLTSEPRVAGGVVARGGEPVERVVGADTTSPYFAAAPEGRASGEVVERGYAQQRAGALRGDITKLTNDLGVARQTAADTSYSADVREIARNRVADLEGQISQLERSGPNVRAVDVPENLRLIDADAPPTPDIKAILQADYDRRLPNHKTEGDLTGPASMVTDDTFANLYKTAERLGYGSKASMNRALADAGYDGITYSGGKRIPMVDEAGAPIEHQATVVFPTALDSLRNAVSGRQGGAATTEFGLHAAGAVGGGVAGYESAPEDASIEERAKRTAIGAGAGLLGANVASRGLGKLLYEAPAKAATGHAGRDATIDMFRTADAQPSVPQRAVEGASKLLGLGGRTGSLDTAMADKFAYINQMTGRAKQALGAAFTPEMDAEAHVATYAGRGGRALQRIKDDIAPALDLVRKNGDVESLNEYRKYQRDLEVANLNGGVRNASAGVTSAADALDRLNALEASMGPTQWKELVQADDMINAAQAKLLTERADAGLIDKDLAEALIRDHPHYNPTVVMKYLDESHAGVSSGGQGFGVTTNLLKRLAADGSTDATETPLRSLVRHFVQNDVLINRNETAQSIIRAAQNDPTLAGQVKRLNPMRTVTGPEVAGPAGPASKAPGEIATVLQRRFGDQPGQMSVYENGKRVYYSIPEGLEAAVKGLDAKTSGAMEKILSTANEPLRFGAVVGNPQFLVTNAVADAVSTFVREGTKTAAGIPKGWYAAATRNDLYKDYVRAGGSMESLFQRSPKDLDKLVESTGGILVRNPGDLAKMTGDALSSSWLSKAVEPVRRAGEIIEQGPRLATFERHLKAGESPREAATAGRRVTVDFSRSGDAIRQANAVSLFLNARVQGMLNVPRTLRDNPESRARVAALGAMAVGAYKYNSAYPEYWDIPRYIRDQNMVFMLPGSEKDPNGPGYKKLNYIAVPLREWSQFTAPLTYAMAKIDQEHGHDPRTFGEFAQDDIQNASPLPGQDVPSGVGGLIPAPARSFLELKDNRRFFTGLPIVPESEKDLPPSAQYDPERTSLTARKIGEMTGMSPRQADFLIQENLGGAGKTVTGAIDTLAGKPADTPPVVGGLAGGVYKTYGGQLQADQYDQLNKQMSALQEPAANTVRALPEFAEATRDRQDAMLRTGQLELRDALSQQLGIETTPRDLGLPNKYVGVDDKQQEARIDDARAALNAWKADPINSARPTNEEATLATRYEKAVSPKYTFEKNLMDKRNVAIRKLIDEYAAAQSSSRGG